MRDFYNFFDAAMSPEDRKELERRTDQALAPRNKDGLIVPIIPVGPGPAADMVGQIYYPAPKPDQNGCVSPIIFDQDFVGGQLPPYMEYVPGWERPDQPYDGRTLNGIVYCDPIRNLPPYQQALLRQISISPSQTVQPEDNLGPTDFVMPKSVQKTPYGMAVETREGKELLSNFNVTAVRRFVIKQYRASDAEEFELEVSHAETIIGQLPVSADRLDNLVPIIAKRFPACHTNEDATKANLRIANAIRDQIPNLPVVTVVKSPGFICLGGLWVYAHDGATFNGSVEFHTKCTIPCAPEITQVEALKAALGVLELADNSPVMLPLLLLAYQGFLFNLFEAAGITPKAPIFLNGETGSFKTSVTQALYRPFMEQAQSPEASFRDTKAAIEVKIGEACSRVLVVDDFQPPVTAATGREILEKLELLIRLFGDGIAKSRSNSEPRKAKEFRPAGCCLITGEDTGGSRSTLLRCLILPLKKWEISGERLKFYQDHPEYLRNHWFYFLRWAGDNGDAIIDFIRNEFQRERVAFAGIVSEPRQADIGATMMLTAKILLGYIRRVMSLDDRKALAIEQRWANSLAELLRCSEEESKELNPVKMYVEALLDLQATGKILLAPSQAEFKRGCHLGFAKDNYWWVFPKEIFVHVTRYWKDQDVIFPIKMEKVHALLYQALLLDVSRENRRGHQKILYTKKSTLENRPRMLVLRIEQARAHVENNED